MDEHSSNASDEQQVTRSGEDRRVPADRRRGVNRLLERFARRDGTETDRRRRERRNAEAASRFSFLWRWAKD
jgi:hypothetical protein